jgi:tellurite resistance protein TerC
LHATLLFAVLVLVELSDVVFAIDSIPAVFSITTDTFIVFTSNMFAILGLRSLYFVLEKLHETFGLVKYGVAAILAFTGVKLILPYFHIDIPVVHSIGAIVGILALSVLASVVKERFAEEAD